MSPAPMFLEHRTVRFSVQDGSSPSLACHTMFPQRSGPLPHFQGISILQSRTSSRSKICTIIEAVSVDLGGSFVRFSAVFLLIHLGSIRPLFFNLPSLFTTDASVRFGNSFAISLLFFCLAFHNLMSKASSSSVQV